VSLLRSAIRAKELQGILQGSGLALPILSLHVGRASRTYGSCSRRRDRRQARFLKNREPGSARETEERAVLRVIGMDRQRCAGGARSIPRIPWPPDTLARAVQMSGWLSWGKLVE